MQLKNLKTKVLGRNAIFYKTIDSTQKEIWRRYEADKITNGTLIYCDTQTAGIGTHGRVWHTDEANNIAFSFYLEPNTDISKLEGITVEIAQTIVQIFEKDYKVKLDIKEPNDIYCRGKKLGGILTQSKIVDNKIKILVVGIGINTNKKTFEGEIKNIATSIINEFNISINTEDFISEFCNEFEKIIDRRTVNI